MNDYISQFHRAMVEAGITPGAPIPADGALHRFHVEGDKPGSRNGWAVLHGDGVPSGAFGSWKADIAGTWCAKDRDSLTPGEQREQRRRIEAAKEARKAEQHHRHEKAAARAARILADSHPANPGHQYLATKRNGPGQSYQRGTALVLPVVDFNRQLTSLQFIDPDGKKLLLSGGRKQGCFIPVNRPEQAAMVLICEGWATGATLAENYPQAVVLAAIDAGNLKAVATGARTFWPDAEIVVCGDDDRGTLGNPGATAARAAAIAAGAKLAMPEWPEGSPLHLTDFNDLVNWQREVAA